MGRAPRAIRGEALCRQGYATEGLTLLEAHLSDLTADHYEYDPRLAWLRAITGNCALDAGGASGARRDAAQRRATELATLARETFARQPGVSGYYKAPYHQLAKRLGGRQRG